jgi:hypothetical protein
MPTYAIVLAAVAVVLVAIVVIAALRPADFRVSRSDVIPAPPAAVFPLVNDFHRWESWSPWAKIDPAMKLTFSGPESGVGAGYHWTGNNAVGEGRMTIAASESDRVIRIDLEFKRPMPGICPTEFTFAPEAGGTRVTWTMTGRNNLVARIVGLFMNMDDMIGKQFAQGLTNMKSVAGK